MNLNEYQAQALTTCLPSARSREYLIPGIVAEVGELYGKRAKSVRDDWAEDRLQHELAFEYGDVAWMTAILLDVEGVHTIWAQHHPRAMSFTGGRVDPFQALLSRVVILANADFHDYVLTEAQGLWKDLEQHCQTVTGWSFEDVLKANLDKLASRQQRGVLTGAGDNR